MGEETYTSSARASHAKHARNEGRETTSSSCTENTTDDRKIIVAVAGVTEVAELKA